MVVVVQLRRELLLSDDTGLPGHLLQAYNPQEDTAAHARQRKRHQTNNQTTSGPSNAWAGASGSSHQAADGGHSATLVSRLLTAIWEKLNILQPPDNNRSPSPPPDEPNPPPQDLVANGPDLPLPLAILHSGTQPEKQQQVDAPQNNQEDNPNDGEHDPEAQKANCELLN